MYYIHIILFIYIYYNIFLYIYYIILCIHFIYYIYILYIYIYMEAWKSKTNFEPNHSHDSLHRNRHELSQAELSDGIFTFEKCDADSGGAISVALVQSKIEWDQIPTDPGPSKLRSSYEILRFFRGPWTVGPVGDFLDWLEMDLDFSDLQWKRSFESNFGTHRSRKLLIDSDGRT